MQSSALPLGHAAIKENKNPLLLDRISQDKKCVLFLCNGHGEDLIALRVLEELHKNRPDLALEVLPLVGKGKCFDFPVSQGWLKRIGPLKVLPSGGFSNQSLKGLLADIFQGMLCLIWKQLSYVRSAASNGRLIIAVGDLLPLLFAWSSRRDYVFIGTPKSDYTWTSKPDSFFSDFYHRLKGSEWDPWENFFMANCRCKFVAVRDKLTARGLRINGVSANALGNPMMDGFKIQTCPIELKKYRRFILLCGTRMPEAKNNFHRILTAVEYIDFSISKLILVALGDLPDIQDVECWLEKFGYKQSSSIENGYGAKSSWKKGSTLLFLGVGQFSCWAQWAEVGLANAGTATEQIAGLGVPCVSLPGKGPQFKYGFAIRQSRLLGGAVITCKTAKIFARSVESLLFNHKLRNELGAIGKKRMGKNGGSAKIAQMIEMNLFEGH